MTDLHSPAENTVVANAAAFARDYVAPQAEEWERNRSFPHDTLRAAAGAGLVGLMLPQAAGGKGLGHAAAARVLEELAAVDFAFSFSLWVHNNVCNAIYRSGASALTERLLGAMLRCDRIGAFCMTEPTVGSDAAQLTTRAEKRGNVWSISGEKAWVTNAATADVMTVYARVGDTAGWRGIATFLVEASAPGVERLPVYSLLGGNAMGIGGFRFAAVSVSTEAMLLGPGDGFKTAMSDIDKARMFVAAACVGILRSALSTAIAYGVSRKAFNRPILDFQGLQWDLVDVATHLEAARLLTKNAADKLDRGEPATVAAAYAKKFATRAAVTGVAACMSAMGASGLKTGVPLARHLAAAKLAETVDGTTAIQNLVIARSLDLGGRQV